MKNIKLAILFLALTVSTSSFAQFEDFLRGGTDDANVLFNNYMTPFMKGMGYGFNNGWYNTAKPHESFGFDLTISVNAAIVPEVDQSFLFDQSEYTFTKLGSGASTGTLPTLMGGNTTEEIVNYIDDPFNPGTDFEAGRYPAPNGFADDIKRYSGIDNPAVPAPIVQVGIGLFKGTEIKVRWLPTITTEDFNFKYFGIGGMHSISQWLPVIKDMEFLDISAFVGYTKISAEYAIPENNFVQGANQIAAFDVNTFTYQILASAHVSVITGYIGLGMDNFNTNFKMLGTYVMYSGDPIIPELSLENPINIKASGNNSFRTTFGARLKLAILTLHFDYTIKEYNTMTAGIGFSFR